MPPYDSDSSECEDDYTETNVLLGYASTESTDDTISHLGGHPTWLDDNTPPSGTLAKCKVCNDLLSLLLELNGDLPERFPGHERRLYLFGCRRRTCRRKEGSIRGIRAIRSSGQSATVKDTSASRPQTSPPPQPPKQNLGSSIFGSKPPSNGATSVSNPFASPSSSNASLGNPFASASSLSAKPLQTPEPEPTTSSTSTNDLAQTFAAKARINADPPTRVSSGPPAPWPAQSAFPPPYPHYSLDAEYEALDASPPTIPQQTRLEPTEMDLDDEPSSSGGATDKEKDTFESSMDRTFQRFADRVGQNATQVLRYEFGGAPLLYARDDAVGKILAADKVPGCASCGAHRTFEVQLTPHAITELEAEEDGLEGMEWGTVVLQVCERDCVPRGVAAGVVGYVEEWVGVQWEEQSARK